MIRKELTMEEDLKSELLQLKKQFATTKTDNQALKVSVRKLEDELHKKDKQIEILLNPEKSANFRKFVSDKGATMIFSLKNKVDKLEKELREKDVTIKRLKCELETSKIYGGKHNNRKESVHSCPVSAMDIRSQTYLPSPTLTNITLHPQKNDLEKSTFQELSTGDQKYLSEECEVEVQFKRKDFPKQQSSTRSSSMSVQTDIDLSKTNDQCDQLKYLEEIIKGIIGDPSTQSNTELHSRRSDTNIELKNQLKEEIKQLHEGFQKMTSQVDNLKMCISKLRSDQLKTESVLKKKDTTFEKVLDELKAVRKSFHNWPTTNYTPPTKFSPGKQIQRPHSNQDRDSTMTDPTVTKIVRKKILKPPMSEGKQKNDYVRSKRNRK